MARVYVLLLMVNLAMLVVALFDCLSCDRRRVRSLPQRTWVFVILLTSPIGSLAWFVKGQPAPAVRTAGGTVLRSAAALGPEDDPDFIAALASEVRRLAGEK